MKIKNNNEYIKNSEKYLLDISKNSCGNHVFDKLKMKAVVILSSKNDKNVFLI